ncbi:L-arabinose transport system permease protein AraQ [Paenibacillus konkukensis]|uniref:L-arabinose transport system permease protein AraQ n=1 Tax=Paenibacillus konkukensis TaxID=2020716 RepID=A0ABY4RVA0_9BACL|nr:carbohydrate ABC transporter permease [Paenibacillus konkukensis]UQZ86376.1 L-arabinose transport system permease protein AraQ [Paenibacillus konkukensis]
MRLKLSAFDVINGILMLLFCFSIIYPFIYLIGYSLSTAESLYSGGVSLLIWPKEITFEAYRKFLSMDFIYTGFFNTVFRTVIGTLLSLLVMSCAAYALSKKYLPHRKFYTTIFIITIFFNGGLIPTYLLMRNLHLIDNIWVFVLGPLINAFYLLILRNFFMHIPPELEESAKMDGAGELRFFFQIIIPLSLPSLATIGLWQAVHHWNSWFDSLIYINSIDKHVISVHIRRLVIEQDAAMNEMLAGMANQQAKNMPTPETMRAAAIMVTTLPILCVYPFIQKYFVQGVMVGAVKG